MELKVNLPDTLASEAKAAGLLTPQAIERLLREAETLLPSGFLVVPGGE